MWDEINKEKTENVSVGFRIGRLKGNSTRTVFAGWWKQKVKEWR